MRDVCVKCKIEMQKAGPPQEVKTLLVGVRTFSQKLVCPKCGRVTIRQIRKGNG